MKSLKLMVVMLFTSITTMSVGQEKINSYDLSYFKEPTNSISVSESKEGIDFYIEVPSRDRSEVSLIVREKSLDKFKSVINDAKLTYAKWKKTAEENDVSDLDKEIEIDKMNIECAFHYGSWNFDFSVNIKARFKILNGEYMLIIQNKNKLQSSSNQYIDADGFLLAFSSEEEIDDFLKVLSLEDAKNYFNEKTSKENLFKD